MVHLQIRKHFTDDSSVNFYDKFFLHFLLNFRKKMMKKLVMEIYRWVVRKVLTDLWVDQVNSAYVNKYDAQLVRTIMLELTKSYVWYGPTYKIWKLSSLHMYEIPIPITIQPMSKHSYPFCIDGVLKMDFLVALTSNDALLPAIYKTIIISEWWCHNKKIHF